MFYLILQTALLILAAFVLGAIAGCLLHRLFARGGVFASTATPAAAAPAVAAPATAAPATASSQRPTSAEPAAVKATVAAKTAPIVEPEPIVAKPAVVKPAEPALTEPALTEPVPAPAEEMDDAAAEAAIAALPADASNEDKANAVGVRPAGLDAPLGSAKDNLQRIKGIGKVNEGKLNGLGIYHFSQIKEWSPSEARWVGTFLSFSGRIEREDWIGQSDVLSSGGETDFAKRVDKGQVSSSSNKSKKK